MASREFDDERGAVWVVWEVQPEAIERRMREDPLLRPKAERRRVPQFRARIANPVMARGWLTFETRGEKRRLAPVPEHWDEMTDQELRHLLSGAEPVKPSRRLIE